MLILPNDVPAGEWRVRHAKTVTRCGFPSRGVVGAKVTRGQ